MPLEGNRGHSAGRVRVMRGESLAHDGGLGVLGWGDANLFPLEGSCLRSSPAAAPSVGWCENVAIKGQSTNAGRERACPKERRHVPVTMTTRLQDLPLNWSFTETARFPRRWGKRGG